LKVNLASTRRLILIVYGQFICVDRPGAISLSRTSDPL
jgi:hypothetical protein